jgi:hypothetical protein
MSDRRQWEGGYVYKDGKGRDVYVIRRAVAGTRYEVSTRAHSARAALQHLARFEADPGAYSPTGTVAGEPVYLDVKLVEAFLTWSREVRNNTRKWVGEQRSGLAWWAEQIGHRDLRGLSLSLVVVPALDGTIEQPRRAKGRAHKIAALKALYSWLRRERHLLTSVEDPTVDLAMPQSSPAQRHQVKEHTPEVVAKVLSELAPERRRARLAEEREVDIDQIRHMTDYRDHLRLAAATAWHVTELARFASSGRILEATELQRGDGSDLVLETVHKNGETFRTRVGGDTSAAARRIRDAGGFSIERYAEAVAEAARAADIKTNFRGALRHSALTWVSELEGEEAAQKVARHKSPRTTKKNYTERAAPPNPLTRLRLVE